MIFTDNITPAKSYQILTDSKRP